MWSQAKNDEKEQDKNEESHLIQKKMLDSRSIIIYGEINQALTEKVVSQLLLLQEIDDRPIKLYIIARAAMLNPLTLFTISSSSSSLRCTSSVPAGSPAPALPFFWRRRKPTVMHYPTRVS